MEISWQQILGKMTNGIYVLTTCHKDEINGMIISWVSQVSYDPPLVMVAIHPNRYSHHLVEQSGVFALHIVAQNQTDFLGRFKGPEPSSKFDSIQWHKGETGCPVFEDCIAYIECEVTEILKPGNHSLFIGEIKNGQFISNKDPMSTLDYSGTYVGKD